MMSLSTECQESTHLWGRLLPWIICVSASLFFFYEFIQGNMFASIADNIMQDFRLKADKMSYLSSSYYLSNVLFLFVAGYFLDKYSTKRTMLVAMFLCVLSTFILATTHSFYVALACRFVMGIGSAFCFLGPIRLASRWFPPRRMALVTGIIVTIAMTGGMLAQYPLTRLVAEIGWRDALMQVGYLGVMILVIMYFGIIDRICPIAAKAVQSEPVLKVAESVIRNMQTLKAALYASLMNMGIAVFGAMMGTLYLVQRMGVSKADAALVNSMLFLGAILGGPIFGWFSDRLGLRLLPMKIGALGSFVLLLIILFCPVSVDVMKILFFCFGFFTATQIISYVLVAESSPVAQTAMAVSVVSFCVQGGYIIYQTIFGALLERHGGMLLQNDTPVYSLAAYQHAALILPVGLLLAYFCLMGLKETHGKHIEG